MSFGCPLVAAFPFGVEGRLLQDPFSEPARRSRKFWPVSSLSRLKRPVFLRGFLWYRYLHHHSDCYRLERPVTGWDLHPLNNNTFTAHTPKGLHSTAQGRAAHPGTQGSKAFLP
jgi:hypothetical protein